MARLLSPHRTWIALLSGFLIAAAGLPAAAQSPRPSLPACDATMEAGDSVAAVRCYLALAHGGAAATETVAGHLTARLARDAGETQTRFALARIRASQGHPEAETLLRSVIDEFSRSRNPTGEVLARTSLASFVSQRGNVEEAERILADGETVANASGESRLVAWVHTMQAWDAYRELDYGRGMRLLQGVKTTIDGSTDIDLKSSWLSAMGATLWALGRWTEARATYESEVAMLHEAGNRFDEASALSNVVLLSSGPQRRAVALETARIARESGNLAIESSAYLYLAESAPPGEARAYAKRSLDLAVAAHSPTSISRAQGALAVLTVPVDPVEAFRLIDDAIDKARGVGDPNQAVRQRFLKANMRWQAGPRAQAIADSETLLDAIERLRAFQPEDSLRAERFGQWRFAYYRLAGHLLARHLTPGVPLTDEDAELAFSTLERMRSRMLLDRLDAARATERTADSPLRTERIALLHQIAEVNRQLAHLAVEAGPEREQARARLEDLESRAADVDSRLARAEPGFGELHQPRLATLAEIRDALAPDEALITYQSASAVDRDWPPYGGWIWTITKAEARAVPLEAPETLPTAVDVFVGLIERRDNSEKTAAARLYKRLIAPALESLGAPVSKLILIPDEALYRLPFDALRETPDAQPLGLQRQITLAPSATMWLRWRRTPPVAARIPALVLADPTLPAYSATDAPAHELRSGLWPLPEARIEGRSLVRALGGGSRMFAGADASERLVKRTALTDYRILHFAAHAVIDDIHPERSAVLLAPGAPDGDDGFLQAREIADLHLSGQVVFLSACRSAGGALVPGEGTLGLAHAFFRAGAGAVVATLWPIRDDDARDAFDLIGQSLGQGTTVAAAVTAARTTLARRGLPAAAWASLIVMGNGEQVPLAGGRRWEADAWLYAALGCAGLACAAWIVRRRAR